MFLIKIFCDFCDSNSCKLNFEKICLTSNISFYGIDKQVYITNENNFTHAIIMNKAMPILHIPKENVIGLAFEPYDFLNINDNFIEYAKKNIGKYFIGDKRNLPSPFIEHFSYMWHSNPGKEINNKTNIMSIIVSEKQFAPGHKYRHELVKKIIQNNLPIDIYGRGANNYIYKYIKGKFNDAEPYENYKFSISIENFRHNHYMSEKILTPLMYNCLPIYYGCNMVDKYFDDIITLSGNIENDLKLLVLIIKNPDNYYKNTYTEKNNKTINLIENVSTIFAY